MKILPNSANANQESARVRSTPTSKLESEVFCKLRERAALANARQATAKKQSTTTTTTDPNMWSAVRREIADITSRFEAADRRKTRSQTIEDYADAHDERMAIAGEFWAAESQLADLLILLLRIAVKHQPDLLRLYIAEVLRPELNPILDALVKLEDRR